MIFKTFVHKVWTSTTFNGQTFEHHHHRTPWQPRIDLGHLLPVLPLLFCACPPQPSSACDEAGEPCSSGTTAGTAFSSEPTTTDPPTTTGLPGTTEVGSGTSDLSASGTSDTTTTETTAEPGTTTGEPAPVCGNRIVEDLEDCDDGNDDSDDGCSDCGRDRTVFVSSKKYQGGILMGLFGADQLCRGHADMAGLPDPVKYMAWLSDSQTNVRDRMFHGRGRYVLVNGLVVAQSWSALLQGPLQNPINVNELSQTYDYGAWTSTAPDGTTIPGANHCVDWTMNGLNSKAFVGSAIAVDSEWTFSQKFDSPAGCGLTFALYCFEQE